MLRQESEHAKLYATGRPCGLSDPTPFVRAGLKKKLKDLMAEFSELRAKIHEENRQVVQRRVYTVTGQHLPEDEIDQMIETGKQSLH